MKVYPDHKLNFFLQVVFAYLAVFLLVSGFDLTFTGESYLNLSGLFLIILGIGFAITVFFVRRHTR